MSTPAPPQVTPAVYLRLVLSGAIIGIPAALLAAAFLALVHLMETWLWDDLPAALGLSGPPWYLVIGLPTVGALVVLAARRLLPGDGGHRPLAGIAGAPTPLAYAPGVALAALGTLAFGAVLGPEAPLIALGSAVGMAVTRFVRVGERESAVLATAGSFSAISALFGGPIVAGMMMVEGGLAMGKLLIPILIPGFVAAAIGYVIFIGLGDWGGLQSQALTIPNLPVYEGTSVRDLLLGIAFGLLTALVVAAVRRLAGALEARALARRGMAVTLIAGGLVVGLIAWTASLLGADSQDILFSGQAGIPDLVTARSVEILALVVLAKAAAYAVSLGSGFRGGPVFPAIFLGIGLAMIPVLLVDGSPTLAVAIGTAAGLAAMTRLLITAVIFAALLVGTAGTDTIPAAVLAAVTAWLVMAAIDRRWPAPDAASADDPATSEAMA